MTIEEAKAWLESIEFEVAPYTQKALIIAIEALDMQIKMKNNCDDSCADCAYRRLNGNLTDRRIGIV